jgi:hypothetical protein
MVIFGSGKLVVIRFERMWTVSVHLGHKYAYVKLNTREIEKDWSPLRSAGRTAAVGVTICSYDRHSSARLETRFYCCVV